MPERASPAAPPPSVTADAGGLAAAPVTTVVQLVADYHARLYRYAYRLCGSAADAEDLVQQAFLIAHEKLDQLRDTACASGWLHTVLRNCYLKGCRKSLGLPISEMDVGTLPAEPPTEPIDGEALQAALSLLDPDFKVVVLMYYFEEKSYREIAEELGIPLGTVMSRLSRAKAHLRDRLTAEEASQGAKKGPWNQFQNV
jgi:RNA polymerase sigma-70 factor (ECF subfamily)